MVPPDPSHRLGGHMDLRGKLSRTAFEAALTPADVMTSQVIQGAMISGVLAFTLAVAFMYTRGAMLTPGDTDLETVRMLTIVHLVFLTVNVGLSLFFTQRLFSPEGMKDALASDDPEGAARRCVMQQRTALVARLAVLEGSAFFGLAVCMIGAMNGVLRVTPAYWINLLSPFLLVSFGIATFPSRERLVAWFEERFLTP